MISAKGSALQVLAVTANALLLLCCGCGGSTSKLTATQSAALVAQTAHSFVASSVVVNTNSCASASTSDSSSSSTSACTIPVNANVLCPDGGQTNVSGSLTGNSGSALGYFSGSLSQSLTKCVVSGTNLVISGEPALTANSAITYFTGGNYSVAAAETGSVAYGSKPSEVCPVDLTITAYVTSSSGKHSIIACTVTGKACGYVLDQTQTCLDASELARTQ